MRLIQITDCLFWNEDAMVYLQKGNIGYWTGAATKENILSMINLSNEGVKIKAENISLEGTVTANGNVQIREDGSIVARKGVFYGSISAPPLHINKDNFDEILKPNAIGILQLPISEKTGFNFLIEDNINVARMKILLPLDTALDGVEINLMTMRREYDTITLPDGRLDNKQTYIDRVTDWDSEGNTHEHLVNMSKGVLYKLKCVASIFPKYVFWVTVNNFKMG